MFISSVKNEETEGKFGKKKKLEHLFKTEEQGMPKNDYLHHLAYIIQNNWIIWRT